VLLQACVAIASIQGSKAIYWNAVSVKNVSVCVNLQPSQPGRGSATFYVSWKQIKSPADCVWRQFCWKSQFPVKEIRNTCLMKSYQFFEALVMSLQSVSIFSIIKCHQLCLPLFKWISRNASQPLHTLSSTLCKLSAIDRWWVGVKGRMARYCVTSVEWHSIVSSLSRMATVLYHHPIEWDGSLSPLSIMASFVSPFDRMAHHFVTTVYNGKFCVTIL
jgi:hypothetical protein